MNDVNPRNVGKRFKCNIPCVYREYVLEEETQIFLNEEDDQTAVYITLSTPEVLIKEEKQIYEVTSLVGDVGGSLGLFLGFSLLMVWDWIHNALKIIREAIN